MKVEPANIKPRIFSHPEFNTYTKSVKRLFAKWQDGSTPLMKGIKKGSHPKALIETLSEELLGVFKGGSAGSVRLINPYDVYQHLMSYWSDTMQDDVYMLVSDGWKALTDGKPNTDLIPQHLIVNRYFAAEQKAIEKLETERDDISRRMEEMDEEQGGEEGLLFEAKTEKGKLTKVSVNARLKELKLNKDNADERKALEAYAALIEKESVAGKKVKEEQKILDAKVTAQYAKLGENEIKILVVDDKWLATISTDVQTELDRVSQALTGRIKQLAERYATPLPRISEEVDVLSGKVDEHLKMMGFVWS